MKKYLFVGFLALVAATFWLATSPEATADEYENPQYALIRSRCNSLRSSLQRLRITDSNARAYLGSVYLFAAGDFLTPLNLRLVRNDIHAPELITTQTDFAEARNAFADAYTEYARGLEALLRINCYYHPGQFLVQLQSVRRSRTVVKEAARHADSILERHKREVRELKGSL